MRLRCRLARGESFRWRREFLDKSWKILVAFVLLISRRVEGQVQRLRLSPYRPIGEGFRILCRAHSGMRAWPFRTLFTMGTPCL